MARFAVYRNPGGSGCLLDLQADLLDGLNTRVVVPLLPPGLAPKPAQQLNPVFEIDGEPLVMVTQFLAAIPLKELKSPVGSLAGQRDAITAAAVLLLQGF